MVTKFTREEPLDEAIVVEGDREAHALHPLADLARRRHRHGRRELTPAPVPGKKKCTCRRSATTRDARGRSRSTSAAIRRGAHPPRPSTSSAVLPGAGSPGTGRGLVDRDPVLLRRRALRALPTEADRLAVTDEEFGRSMAGDAIEHATQAILEDFVSFCPNPRDRKNLRRVVSAMWTTMEKARDVRGVADRDRTCSRP
jgi:hypothetical protein